MDIAALKLELAKPAYAGLSDDAAAALINSTMLTRTVSKFVSYRTMLAEIGPALTVSIKGKLDAASATNPLIALVASMMSPGEGGIDVGNPTTIAQIQDLQTGGLFSADEATALLGMAHEQYSFATTFGVPSVGAQDVTTVRGMV